MKLLIVLVTLLLLNSPAYAYIDPGTGSFIIQGIIASFLSVVFTCKMYWQRIKNYFSKNKNLETPTINDDSLNKDSQ